MLYTVCSLVFGCFVFNGSCAVFYALHVYILDTLLGTRLLFFQVGSTKDFLTEQNAVRILQKKSCAEENSLSMYTSNRSPQDTLCYFAQSNMAPTSVCIRDITL